MQSREHYQGSPHELIDATAHYRKGNNDQAITKLDGLIRQQPKSMDAYIIRGSAYQQKGEAHKALADFDQTIGLDPKSARAFCDRGILEDVLLQQPNKALADYDEAIRLAPNFYRAYVNRGVHFEEQHDYERALRDFTRAIQLQPDDLGTHAYRAYAYAKLGQRSPAQADAGVAIRLKPAEMPLARVDDLMMRGRCVQNPRPTGTSPTRSPRGRSDYAERIESEQHAGMVPCDLSRRPLSKRGTFGFRCKESM
jgi:tetratricopeptide (TPR) repeat protein